MNRCFFATVLCAASISAAFADSQFSGPYIGAQIGYAEGNDDGREYYEGAPESYTQNTSPDGEFFGLTAGINKVLENNILLGLEVDYDYKDADDSTVQDDDGIPDIDYPYKTEINESASIRGRLGYVFNNDQTLVYATGGYTMAKIDRKTYDIDYPADVSSDSKWNDGWTAGLGVEHLVTTNLSARIEYRYSEYSTEHLDASVAYGDGYLEKQDYDEDSLRIGIAYYF